MKLPGLVNGSYQERSLSFDAQRTINLYPVANETGQGKESAALYGTPGLEYFTTLSDGAVRGVFYSANGRAFAVSQDGLYEISSAGVATYRGTINTTSGVVTITENTTQLAVCDGADLYTLTYSSNAFAEVSDGDFPGAETVTFLDGYFAVNKPNSGEFYISNLYDGTGWEALDFATAESSPDRLVRVFGALGQLWLFGVQTTEVWYNSGGVDFPFARVEGAKSDIGCAAPYSVQAVDNTIFWLGRNAYGQGVVYRVQGYAPTRISTHAIEYALNKIQDLSGIRAYVYQQDGHLFYALTGGGLETTFVYDAATKLWHERAYLEDDGTYSTHLAIDCMFAFNKHIVGDKNNGNLYVMSLDTYTDNGREIRRERTLSHLNDEGKRFRARELQVDFEYGSSSQLAYSAIVNATLTTDYRTISDSSLLEAFSGESRIYFSDPDGWDEGLRFQTGDVITFSGLGDIGGIPSAEINGSHAVVEYATATYYFETSTTASSSATAAGSFQVSSGLMKVSSTAHGLEDGDTIRIIGSTIGGIDAEGTYDIRVVDASNDDGTNTFYTYQTTQATSEESGNIQYETVSILNEPVARLQVSTDGARTWSQEYSVGIGKTGEYRKRAVWRRLGYTENQMTFRVIISDPVKVAICGAYLR